MTRPPRRETTHFAREQLVAILANPRFEPSGRSEKRVALARDVLGFKSARIANLFAWPSASSRDIALLGKVPEGWQDARRELTEAVYEADAVLVGFGLIPSSRESGPQLRAQLRWLHEELRRSGHVAVWQVGDRPRHPSRWHQYVSDAHGRTAGGTFEERLHQVLRAVPLDDCDWA
ncbi:hypothetical protein GCM10023065_01970 [Microbacterium laevaniformans]|nr:hypothetical protein GCM10017578_27200 [Microbacterium laevaniformans]